MIGIGRKTSVVVMTIQELLEDERFKPVCGYDLCSESTVKEQVQEIADFAFSIGYILAGCMPSSNGGIITLIKIQDMISASAKHNQ